MEATREKTLKAHFATVSNASAFRPVMTSLNGDLSWLLSFPRPVSERQLAGKIYYHIVFEPWLNGAVPILAGWFMNISLKKKAEITSAEEVVELVREIETAAAAGVGKGEGGIGGAGKRAEEGEERKKRRRRHWEIDAIMLGFHYDDHCHEATLRMFDPSIPVIAVPEAATVIAPWKHFEEVHLIPILKIPILNSSASTSTTTTTLSWRTPELHSDGLPSWLTAIKMPGHHELNYVLALIWSHPSTSSPTSEPEIHEVIFETPHGLKSPSSSSALETFLTSTPRTQNLALMAGLKESWAFASINTFGAKGSLALWRHIGGARYWVLNHHSLLDYTGVLPWVAWVHDVPRTLGWALGEEEKVDGMKGDELDVVKVENGGCFVLV